MRLRELCIKDAPFMLEWMHDPTIVNALQTDFASKTIQDCENFISESQNDEYNLHKAIVDDNDEYMGTVSLKNISNNCAEFAIAIRSCAMGKGYSKYGMSMLLSYGFESMHLDKIYWCVRPQNRRAICFYEKNGYLRINSALLKVEGYSQNQIQQYFWYCVQKEKPES